MADSDHLAGALIITVVVTAMAEVARPLRFLNVGFRLWLVVASWLLGRFNNRFMDGSAYGICCDRARSAIWEAQ
jgi:hypothetical protein